jgi:hypothetical protein
MKKFILISALALTACSTTVPVKQNFPEVPSRLMTRCPQLETITDDQASLTDMLKVIVQNYTTYYQCAVVSDGWQEWYQIQKQIFEEVNK